MSSYKFTHDEVDEYLKSVAKDMRDFKLLSRKTVSFASNMIYIEQYGTPENRTYRLTFVYKTSKDFSNNIALVTARCLKAKNYTGPEIISTSATCDIDPQFYCKPISKTQIHVAKFMKALLDQNFSCWMSKINNFSDVIHDKTRTLNRLRFEELERISKGCLRKLNLYTNEPIWGV